VSAKNSIRKIKSVTGMQTRGSVIKLSNPPAYTLFK
jgi:hypothetical protein